MTQTTPNKMNQANIWARLVKTPATMKKLTSTTQPANIKRPQTIYNTGPIHIHLNNLFRLKTITCCKDPIQAEKEGQVRCCTVGLYLKRWCKLREDEDKEVSRWVNDQIQWWWKRVCWRLGKSDLLKVIWHRPYLSILLKSTRILELLVGY